ncbi:DNA-binding response regulator [Actinocatenispora rupis]|uniref:DNA-binding response regulator n=1 Tax=Actinocatenispora rupis TaxID=519421 RepID=A0A8J3N8Z2_9ACTN|nr:DNA-binding response regulator [Actinocatenispora rupis]
MLVCDDHLVFAESLALVFVDAGHTVTGVTGTVDEVVDLLGTTDVDVCVLDVHLADGDLVDRLAEIRAAAPDARLVLLTGRLEPGLAPLALAAGVAGLVHKGQHVGGILDAVRRVHAGETVVDPVYRRPARAEPALYRLAAFLTPREREVLCRLVRGEHTAALARAMGITPATARCHIQSVLTKLGAHTRLEAATTAVRTGLVSAETGRWLAA